MKKRIKDDDEKIVHWQTSYDEEAYQRGIEDCLKFEGDTNISENPYKQYTNRWYNWNRGWNSEVDKILGVI